MLWGEGALVTGARRSTRTKATNGQLWEVETVTPALLAFSATIVSVVYMPSESFAADSTAGIFCPFERARVCRAYRYYRLPQILSQTARSATGSRREHTEDL